MNEFDTKTYPDIGEGVFTNSDAAAILNLPTDKVRRWVKKYWEMDFLQHTVDADADIRYTWGEKREKAINFFTLIEIIMVHYLRREGAGFQKIKTAHKELGEMKQTLYPFAHAEVWTDRKNLFYDLKTSVMELDSKRQLSFSEMVKPYCKKIDFRESTRLAERFWPLGKDRSVVVDPHHHFGQPVISGTNITTDSIISMINAGESPDFIASIYELNVNAVKDAMEFEDRSAA